MGRNAYCMRFRPVPSEGESFMASKQKILIVPDFAADLVAVHAGQHQVEQNQVRLEGVKLPDSLFSIVYNFCVIAFLGQIERNQFCDIVIVIDDQNFPSAKWSRNVPLCVKR